jgi:hypothetical protein
MCRFDILTIKVNIPEWVQARCTHQSSQKRTAGRIQNSVLSEIPVGEYISADTRLCVCVCVSVCVHVCVCVSSSVDGGSGPSNFELV